MWREWLSRHPDPDAALLLASAYEQIGRLKSLTGWECATLLQQVRCESKTQAELEDQTPGKVRACRNFLRWVADVADLLTTTRDRRFAVYGATALYVDDAGGDLEQCRAALSPDVKQLLQLGELDSAWRAARMGLQTPAGEIANQLDRENPFSDHVTAHLSAQRVDLYIHGKQAERPLDPVMRVRIGVHVGSCQACQDLVKARLSRLGLTAPILDEPVAA